ncbi:MAG: hypothetical protein OXH37_09735, partial [Gammaproteobacteria bacterium]|nr:hypothetical protein [Gammaproteobacteria bacterium]
MTRIAFLMDPLDSLSLKKDSTLSMVRAAQRRGWEVAFLEQKDLLLQDGEIRLFASPMRLNEPFASSLDPADAAALEADGTSWHSLGEAQLERAGAFDVIMMRKDPPFDME